MEIDILKELLQICGKENRATIMKLFIAAHGVIPDRFEKEIKEILNDKIK